MNINVNHIDPQDGKRTETDGWIDYDLSDNECLMLIVKDGESSKIIDIMKEDIITITPIQSR